MSVTKLLFVCTGNICRSPLAHRLFEHLAAERGVAECYEVESSGLSAYHVGDNADERMQAVAAGHGLRLDHRSSQFELDDLHYYDRVIVMDAGHLQTIRRRVKQPKLLAKIEMFRAYDPEISHSDKPPDVPDPWYGGIGGFENVYEIVHRTTQALLDRLETERSGAPCGSPGRR